MILAKQELCAELLHFCAVVHSCPWKCMRQRQDLSLHVSPIDLPRHNKFLKPKSWEYWLISSLFFSPLSQLSLIYFLVFALITTLSWDIIKLEWVASHPLWLLTDGLASTLNHVTVLPWYVWKEKEALDIPRIELMAQPQMAFFLQKLFFIWNFPQKDDNYKQNELGYPCLYWV